MNGNNGHDVIKKGDAAFTVCRSSLQMRWEAGAKTDVEGSVALDTLCFGLQTVHNSKHSSK